MSKLLDSDYIMRFKNENEIRAHFRRYNDLKELRYTEDALSSELSNYVLERNFSEIDYQLIVEKYGKFHKIIKETLKENSEKVTSPFWRDFLSLDKLSIEETSLWISRLDNINGIFNFLIENPPMSYKEELRKIFQLQQDLNIHLGHIIGKSS